MKRLFSVFCAVVLSAVLILSFAIPSLADFGDFSGDTDWGSSSWGSSSDWGSSDWGSSSYDDDWNSSGSSFGSGIIYDDDDSSGGGFGAIVVIVIIVVILLIVFNRNKGAVKSQAPRVNVNISETPVTHSMAELKNIDPDFSEEALKEKISNLYVQLQNGWQAKDISSLQNTMTDSFYNQMDRQLEAYRLGNQTNKVERIAVLGVQLKGYNEDDVNTTIVAKLDTRIVDYVVDDNTGNIIRGSNTAEKFMTYEWTLIRSKGAKTAKNEGTQSVHCPSCGAPMNVNYSAKCEFCGSVVQTAEYDWVLSGMKGLSQRTNG